jgi:hypothetical protein
MRIAERLRGHPVLAIGAVKIAAEHAEAVGERSRISVRERLLLDGIALHATDVSPRDVERAALVEANLADSGLAFRDGAAVAAGKTADAIAFDGFVEFAFPDATIQDFTKGGQREPLPLF